MDEEKMYTYEFTFTEYSKNGEPTENVITFCGESFNDAAFTFKDWINENKISIPGMVYAHMVYVKADAEYYGDKYASKDDENTIVFRLYDDFDATYAAKILKRYCKLRRSCKGCPLSRTRNVGQNRTECVCGTNPCEWSSIDDSFNTDLL